MVVLPFLGEAHASVGRHAGLQHLSERLTSARSLMQSTLHLPDGSMAAHKVCTRRAYAQDARQTHHQAVTRGTHARQHVALHACFGRDRMTIPIRALISGHQAHGHLQVARTQGVDPTRRDVQFAFAWMCAQQSFLRSVGRITTKAAQALYITRCQRGTHRSERITALSVAQQRRR